MQLDLFIHTVENNQESETHLKENKEKFTGGCRKVLELLKKGIKLTTISAVQHGILSLPRRVKDLRDYNGIEIKDRWLTDHEGKRTIKEYYL